MSDLAEAVGVVRHVASRLGLGMALVGGFAVSVRTEPQFTRDVDFAVAVADDAQAEGLAAQMRSEGHEILGQVEQDATGRLALVHLRLAGGTLVDLLFASSGIEDEIVHAADELEVLEGVFVPVATVAHLIAIKLLARDDHARPQDLVDLRRLIGAASSEDLHEVGHAADLIAVRGFARGRDLRADLDQLLGAD